MNALPLHEIAMMCGGEPPTCGGERIARRLSKDTRTISAGELYIALGGARFDGNDFAAEAAARGAVAAILDRTPGGLPEDFPVIRVEDSLAALHRLATSWRDRLAIKAVAITGSNGKTSVKDFTAAVLGVRYLTIKTEGNLNNQIGLPLSILAARVQDEAAVWEMGTSHPGEIAPLAALARPNVGIITHVGMAHMEFFGSREAIAAEKAGLLEALRAEATAVIPAQDDFADFLAARTRARVVRVGGTDSSIRAENMEISADGTRFDLMAEGVRVPVRLAIPGAHMVGNALLAVAAGLACGVSAEECAEGLSEAVLTRGRLTKKVIRGITFLDDTYNANPDSMVAALRVLEAIPCQGRRIAILGRMGELGLHAEDGYRRVGAAGGCDILLTVGPETTALADAARTTVPQVLAVENNDEAAVRLRTLAQPGDLVLVKGSRSAAMETILNTF